MRVQPLFHEHARIATAGSARSGVAECVCAWALRKTTCGQRRAVSALWPIIAVNCRQVVFCMCHVMYSRTRMYACMFVFALWLNFEFRRKPNLLKILKKKFIINLCKTLCSDRALLLIADDLSKRHYVKHVYLGRHRRKDYGNLLKK